MCFVQNNNGTEHFEDVKQALLDKPSLCMILEIGVFVLHASVAEDVVTVGEKTRILPGIFKHPEKLPAFLSIRRGQHEEHDTQVIGQYRLY